MTKKLRIFTTTAALVRERLAGAEEVAYDGLPLDQLEVLPRRGHLVDRGLPATGRSLAKPLLDSPLGIIPEYNNVSGIIAVLNFNYWCKDCGNVPVVIVCDFASLPEHLLVQGQHGA